MSSEVNKAFVQKFRSNFIHLSQQKGSIFRPYIRVNSGVVGKYDHFDRLGATNAYKITSRHSDTTTVDTPHSRRRVVLEDYAWSDLVDKVDKVKMLADPTSEYMIAGVNAMGRQMDDLVIASATGSATSVGSDDSSSSVSLPAGNQIAHGSAGMTLAKLRQARKILRTNLVDPSEELYCALSAQAIDDLLAESGTAITSIDYNTDRPMVMGFPKFFMGFTIVHSERLATASNIRTCFAWAKSGIGLSVGMDVTTRISERDDKHYSTQVYSCMSLGSTRVEDEKVVSIGVDES